MKSSRQPVQQGTAVSVVTDKPNREFESLPATSEDFNSGKDLVKDYVPESWIFNKVELEQLEEEMESVSRLDDIISTYCNLADDIFQVWLGQFKK